MTDEKKTKKPAAANTEPAVVSTVEDAAKPDEVAAEAPAPEKEKKKGKRKGKDKRKKGKKK